MLIPVSVPGGAFLQPDIVRKAAAAQSTAAIFLRITGQTAYRTPGRTEKLGLESLPDEKKNSPGLFITDETLDSVCLIYKAPDDEIVYRYLDADGNTRSALRDFFETLAGQLQTEGKRGDA